MHIQTYNFKLNFQLISKTFQSMVNLFKNELNGAVFSGNQ